MSLTSSQHLQGHYFHTSTSCSTVVKAPPQPPVCSPMAVRVPVATCVLPALSSLTQQLLKRAARLSALLQTHWGGFPGAAESKAVHSVTASSSLVCWPPRWVSDILTTPSLRTCTPLSPPSGRLPPGLLSLCRSLFCAGYLAAEAF